MPLYALSALTRRELPGKTRIVVVDGYCRAANEDEARGKWMRWISEEHDGYAVEKIGITRIADADVAAAHAELSS